MYRYILSDFTLFWGDEIKRSTPTKVLKKLVFERDKGRCRVCGKKVDHLDFNIGHDKAHSKGGKLTIKNAILLHPLCNRSMQTLGLKQTRSALGLPEPENKTKKALKDLTIPQLKYLTKTHKVKVKGRISENYLFGSTNLRPSKIQYVNALSKVLTEDKIEKDLKEMPKPTKKKQKRKKKSDRGLF